MPPLHSDITDLKQLQKKLTEGRGDLEPQVLALHPIVDKVITALETVQAEIDQLQRQIRELEQRPL